MRAQSYTDYTRISFPDIDGNTFDPAGGLTVVAVCDAYSVTGHYPGIVTMLAEGDYRGAINLGTESTTGFYLRGGTQTGGVKLLAGDATSVVLVGTFDRQILQIWLLKIGGSAHGQILNTSAANTTSWTTDTIKVDIGGYFRSTERSFPANIYFAVALEGVVNDKKAYELLRNPYQLVKPANDAPFLFSVGAPAASCALTEDITNESDITDDTTEITLELTDDTWDASLGTDHASTTALIAGIDGDVVGGTGWNAKVKAIMDFDNVTRNSDTLCTIVVPQAVDYDITATETITVIVPAAAVAGASPIATTPATFEIASVDVAVGPPAGSLALMGLGI
jgi:hypothetical protein